MYSCKYCNYVTMRKNNYNRHKKTLKHLKKVEDAGAECFILPQNCSKMLNFYQEFHEKNDEENIVEKEYKCKYCLRKYTRNSYLQKHINKCKKKEEYDRVEKEKLDELSKQNEELKQIIIDKEKEVEYQKNVANVAGIVVVKTLGITDRIIKYLEQNYGNTPALMPPTNNQIEEIIIDKIVDKENTYCFAKYFIKHKDIMTKIIRDIILMIYNNETPSIISTDISRLSFYIRIKELINKNKEKIERWSKDLKGVKLKKIIIEPLINYIIDEVKRYGDTLVNESEKDINILIEKNEMFVKIIEIIGIDKDKLGNEIMKEIAPYFKLNNKSI